MKQELFSLEGRTALITGGNGVLGRAIALGLRGAGAQVAVTGRQLEKNEAIGQELGDPTTVFTLDVRDEAAVERTVTQVAERFGRLDILVNNAGLFRGGSLLALSRKVRGARSSTLARCTLCSGLQILWTMAQPRRPF